MKRFTKRILTLILTLVLAGAFCANAFAMQIFVRTLTGKTVTLELNGYVLTRDRGDSTTNGEVIWVGPKATLYIYSGTQADPFKDCNGDAVNNRSHRVYVYVADGNRYNYTRRIETLYGGIINGGNSSNAGGGIHMKESAKVYLYNVTIAGNKASAGSVEYGDGGGIEMDNKYG